MAKLNPRVLAKTVKTISTKKERVPEAQIRGTVVYEGGEHYIQLDGAGRDSLTPVANAEEGTKESAFVNGDRVLVLIKNHQAIVTKNLTTGLQVKTAEGALTYDHEYELNSDKTIATFTAHVYRGGIDVTDEFDDELFTWYYKTEDNVDPQPINRSANNDNRGKTMTVPISDMGYGGEIVGRFSTSSTRMLLRSNGDAFTDKNNRKLLARTTASGDEVRVRDLTYTTTLYSTDGILVVQSEEERLATIASLADAIWTEYGITIEDEPLLQGNNVYEDIGLGRITNSEIEALSI